MENSKNATNVHRTVFQTPRHLQYFLQTQRTLHISSMIDVIHSSPKNLETLKDFDNSQLKLLNFQTPLSPTAWTDISNRLLIEN